jgi:diadenosine tetraphosphatase ApaH/serine/threonine PP2A family protein phosphatase
MSSISMFSELWKYLPPVAVIDNRYFCVCGGIGPNTLSLEQIEAIYRFTPSVLSYEENRTSPLPEDNIVAKIEQNGLCDLLWSDPIDSDY